MEEHTLAKDFKSGKLMLKLKKLLFCLTIFLLYFSNLYSSAYFHRTETVFLKPEQDVTYRVYGEKDGKLYFSLEVIEGKGVELRILDYYQGTTIYYRANTSLVNITLPADLGKTFEIFLSNQNDDNCTVYTDMEIIIETTSQSNTPLNANLRNGLIISSAIICFFLSIWAGYRLLKDREEKLKRKLLLKDSPAGTTKICNECLKEVNSKEEYCSFCGNKFADY